MNRTTNDSEKLLALNKPKGYVVTRSDELGRKTVYDLLPDWAFHDGWMPVGRLDLESKGLLLFTTNGKIGDALTKPGNCIKVYEIWVRGHVTDEHIAAAMKGVESSAGLLKAIGIEKKGIGGAKTKLRVEINEGKNRHIRRLFGALKDPKFGTPLKVLKLKRISIGSFKLNLESGKWRYLSLEEERMLIKNLD
jgi:23S rRNA pseudouridine2605 synthase